MNIADAQHNLCNNGELCVSIKSGSDVIIGQICYLKVTLSADQSVLKKISHLLIKDGTNSIQTSNIDDWRINSDKTCGYATFQLQINHDLIADATVNYTVHAVSISGDDVQEITPKQVSYTAKKMGKTILKNDKYTIVPDIPDGSNVISGQYCFLTITVSGNASDIANISNVTISPTTTNLKASPISNRITNLVTSKDMVFLLQVDNGLADEEKVIFTINLMGTDVSKPPLQTLPVNYIVKKLNEQTTIHLTASPEFLNVPADDNAIGTGQIYSVFSGAITADDGKNTPLKHTQILISSMVLGQLYSNTPSVKITTNETNPTHLMPQKLPQKYDNIEFVAVKSDENGKISFRVYAVKDTPVRVDFTIQILRVTYARFVASLYVFNDKPAPVFGISSPFILGLQPGGTLKQTPGESEFQVKVFKYSSYQDTDSIVFYLMSLVNNHVIRLEPVFKLNDITTLSTYRFKFPYNKLKINEMMALYYMIIPQEGPSVYSTGIEVQYIGGGDASPDDNIERPYDKLTVYSSYVTQDTLDPTSYDDGVSEYGAVTLDTIEQQKIKNDTLPPDQQVKTDTIPGLYVVIKGTTDRNDKTLPQMGAKGGISMYLTSLNRQNKCNYKFDLSNPANLKNNIYQIVPIRYCSLNRAQGYHSGAEGTLYFEYYVEDDNGTRTYSKVWQVDLNTVQVGQDPDYLRGCSADFNC